MKKLISNSIINKGIMVLLFFPIVIFSWIATALFIGGVFVVTSLGSFFNYFKAKFSEHKKQLFSDEPRTIYYSKTKYQTLKAFHSLLYK